MSVETMTNNISIYGFPCNTVPFEPIYSVREKLPIYTKNTKSKSQYCAGYYLINFKKGWSITFCPKLIMLERYKFYGPFKTESDSNLYLNNNQL